MQVREFGRGSRREEGCRSCATARSVMHHGCSAARAVCFSSLTCNFACTSHQLARFVKTSAMPSCSQPTVNGSSDLLDSDFTYTHAVTVLNSLHHTVSSPSTITSNSAAWVKNVLQNRVDIAIVRHDGAPQTLIQAVESHTAQSSCARCVSLNVLG